MGWEQIRIKNGGSTLFCNAFIADKNAINIIVTHTPVTSTLEVLPAYAPLTAYGANVFAFDFSGTGNSGGKAKDFSRDSIVRDLDCITDYIRTNYSDNIHLFGNTGIGGMFAQYYVCQSTKVKSFAQFACVHYLDTAGVGYPLYIVKPLSYILRHSPAVRITMRPPKYTGFHAEEDNAFYIAMEKKDPHVWKTSSKILNTLLECFVAKDSSVRSSPQSPTLVFKTLHDRYFQPEYFDRYFASLSCEKKLLEINDVHNSYFIHSEAFCESAYNWFSAHQ